MEVFTVLGDACLIGMGLIMAGVYWRRYKRGFPMHRPGMRYRDVLNRVAEPDEEFMRAVDARSSEDSLVALGVRRAIASLAQVPPEMIHGADTFLDDLRALPFWNDFDVERFRYELECEGIYLSDREAREIPDPYHAPPGYTVAAMASEILGARRSAAQS